MAKTTGNLALELPNYGTNVVGGNNPTGVPNEQANLQAIDAAITALQLGERDTTEIEAASGAIGISEGMAFITAGSAAALTLAAPVAGARSAGGDDGKHLIVMSGSAFAHTVTTPANKINGNKLTATFGAAVANTIEFVAYNGVWYVQNTPVGVTLT